MTLDNTAEHARLEEDATRTKNWKRWGPYLSERQWATVREDYSAYGNCWDYFPHDHARSRAYRWGEDGLLGITDRQCRLCFALALWNGKDPILKERLFGLTGSEGNHGEDVKELYYYLDSTPTHSYMKALYKYPQAEFPYTRLVEENRRRGLGATEFELIDTGVFDEDRYFDVFAEYAKADDERHPDSHHGRESRPGKGDAASAADALVSQHLVVGPDAGRMHDASRRSRWSATVWYARSTMRSANIELAYEGDADAAFHRERNERGASLRSRERHRLREGCVPRIRRSRPSDAVNPANTGTKFAPHYVLNIEAGRIAESSAPALGER